MIFATTRFLYPGEVDPSIVVAANTLIDRPLGDGERIDEMTAWLLAGTTYGLSDARVFLSTDPEDKNEPFFNEAFLKARIAFLKKTWDQTANAYKNQGFDDLQVLALLIYDPRFDGLVAAISRGEVKGPEAVALAQDVASSVPPLGWKWIARTLVADGKSAADADTFAANYYNNGGTLHTFLADYEREKAVAIILKGIDPQLSDEQIKFVSASRLPLDAVAAIFGESRGSSTPLSSLIFPAALSVGAGYLAASSLGGPAGLAIGAAVFLTTMLFSD